MCETLLSDAKRVVLSADENIPTRVSEKKATVSLRGRNREVGSENDAASRQSDE